MMFRTILVICLIVCVTKCNSRIAENNIGWALPSKTNHTKPPHNWDTTIPPTHHPRRSNATTKPTAGWAIPSKTNSTKPTRNWDTTIPTTNRPRRPNVTTKSTATWAIPSKTNSTKPPRSWDTTIPTTHRPRRLNVTTKPTVRAKPRTTTRITTKPYVKIDRSWQYRQPNYTTKGTGNTTFGIYLSTSLRHISTPSYAKYNTYYDRNGYLPKYDHYTVHHYFHNKENVSEVIVIDSKKVVTCLGDSNSFCPANTTGLCTNTGRVMCVSGIFTTEPCSYRSGIECIRSRLSCKGNNSPDCKGKMEVSVKIPCMATAKIHDTSQTSQKFQVTQMYCVTVMVLPAERPLMRGEKIFFNAKKIFSNFVVRALGI